MKGGKDPAGFSLVELLVALVVGAVLAHALLTAQHYSIYLAGSHKKAWESLDLAQELMARRSLDDLSKPTGTWVRVDWTSAMKYRILSSSDPGDLSQWVELSTDVDGTVLHWSWPVAP